MTFGGIGPTRLSPFLTSHYRFWPKMPPLDVTTAGGVVPTMGADGVTAPWQRRQRRRLGLAPSSTTLAVPEAPAEATTAAPASVAVPLAEGVRLTPRLSESTAGG